MMVERVDFIKRLCVGKRVLDIGCVDHHAVLERGSRWLHKHLKSVAKELVGLDYARDELEKLNKKGYNILFGNAENFDLGRKFDIIVAGELIEHLFNPGLFLDSVKKHMKNDSLLIITTPNAFSIRRIIGSLLKRHLRENKEHVAYYSNTTLRQLLERKGFEVVVEEYFSSEDHYSFKHFVERFLLFFLHKENDHGLLFVAKKKKIRKKSRGRG